MGISTSQMVWHIGQNIVYNLPNSLHSTNVGDKLLKFSLQILSSSSTFVKDFQDTIAVYGMGGWMVTVDQMSAEFETYSYKKIAGKVHLLGAQVILFLQGLDKLGLLHLATVGATLGQYSVFAFAFNIHPMLSLKVVKDSLVAISGVFSILTVWDKQLQPNGTYAPLKVEDEIAYTADKAKFIFLSLNIASAFKVVDFSTILVNTSYYVLTIGTVANLIGVTFAACALSKEISRYQKDKEKKILE